MSRIKHILARLRTLITDQQFAYWAFLFMLVLPGALMFFTESTGVWARLAMVLLPLAFYAWALTLSKKPGKMFWWLFIFMFINAFQVVLLYLFGESPIAVDMFLNVLTTNPTEAGELLEQLWPSVVFVVIVYGGGLLLSIVSIRNAAELPRTLRRLGRRIAVVAACLGVVALGAAYATDRRYAVTNDLFPVNGMYNMGLAVQRAGISARYPASAAHFVHHAVSTRPDSLPEVYVMVIGETLRADNMSLYGYNRPTTPRLDALRRSGTLAVYRDAISMSNTTHKSVPLLLTAVGAQGCFDSLYTQRGILSAFREAGYHTAFFSNQRRNFSFIDALGEEAHQAVFAKDPLPMSANQLDTVLVSLVDSALSAYRGGKLMLVVHCYGSHFEYRDRYPQSCDRFGPVAYPGADKRFRKQLVNAYDNTIVFADQVVASIIEHLDSCHVSSALLFTSDHGEDIYDDARGRFLHASPQPTYYQLRVPLLIWTSESFRRQYPDRWRHLLANENNPVSTNMVAFHTLCDLAGLQMPLLRHDLALSNARFTPTRRLYVNDHNELLPLDSCGLKALDIEQFAAHNLQWP